MSIIVDLGPRGIENYFGRPSSQFCAHGSSCTPDHMLSRVKIEHEPGSRSSMREGAHMVPFQYSRWAPLNVPVLCETSAYEPTRINSRMCKRRWWVCQIMGAYFCVDFEKKTTKYFQMKNIL
jgi:hypothetical protein